MLTWLKNFEEVLSNTVVLTVSRNFSSPSLFWPLVSFLILHSLAPCTLSLGPFCFRTTPRSLLPLGLCLCWLSLPRFCFVFSSQLCA